MELGKKICQLRKLSGMTQQQLADKLNISRQTLSKWENETGMPDVESVVSLSALFHTSLDELLLDEKDPARERPAQITLEDMIRINAHNRKMNLLLCSGLLFLAIGIMTAAVEQMLENTTESLGYILYRYIATGQYAPAPVNYTLLMLPAILAGAVGLILFLFYFMENSKEDIPTRRLTKKQCLICLAVLTLTAGIFLLSGQISAKKERADNGTLYGDIIAAAGDAEQFSLCNIGEENDILFITDLTYDDGNGHNAALSCDVYYSVGDTLYPLGKIESMGTAYPVRYGNKCIYTASGHSLVQYSFDRENRKWTTSRYEEIFDTEGNASWQYTENDQTVPVTEKEFLDAFEAYGKATVVNFGYGASDNPY